MGSDAIKSAIILITTTAILATSIERFASCFLKIIFPKISSDALDAAARSCESAVDMVAASMPASMSPATHAVNTPCVLSRSDILMIAVSGSSSTPIDPFAVIALATNPMMIAANIAMKTHTLAILLETESFSSFSIAMNLRRIWGIPKYPSPHAMVETLVRVPYAIRPVSSECILLRSKYPERLFAFSNTAPHPPACEAP